MLVRKSTHQRDIERLETELRLSREEAERQRAGLVADIRREFEEDVIGRLRKEGKEERLRYVRQTGYVNRLVEVGRALLPETAHDPLAPQMPREEAEIKLRRILREMEEEQEWPASSGKT